MIARGDVYWVRIEPRSGSEQRGTRPALVISSDIFNANPRWNSLLIIPCTTSSLQGARPATVVPLVKGSSGLEVDGFAICHQITTFDLRHRAGIDPPDPGQELASIERRDLVTYGEPVNLQPA